MCVCSLSWSQIMKSHLCSKSNKQFYTNYSVNEVVFNQLDDDVLMYSHVVEPLGKSL